MRYLDNYIKFEDKIYEGILDYVYDLDWPSIKRVENRENFKKEYLKELGKKGKLLSYIEKGNEDELTFGILRSLFSDAIEYKKKREFTKGIYKFLHRAIPLALASVWFPIWVIAQILGGSRALNKILIPVLRMKQTNYKNFLVSLITKSMNLMEGEIKMFMSDDWFYRVFMVDWGLIKMLRKEHILDFANHVSEIMQDMPDEDVVPKYYIENELRIYLNNKFNLVPGLPVKTDDNLTENVNYDIYDGIFI